jgi:hypothetical protein
MKMLITVVVLAAIIGGWALFAIADARTAATVTTTGTQAGSVSSTQAAIGRDAPPQPDVTLVFDPIPTVVPQPTTSGATVQQRPLTVQQPVVEVSQPVAPTAAPQPVLRQVSAPPAPVTITSSSQ